MYQQPVPDMAHVAGEFAKWAIMIVGLLISAILSYMFYTTITPPDKPWFPYLTLGLTEGGFVLWFVTFMMSRHSAYSKVLAVIMVASCGLASFVVAGTELHVLFADHYSLANDASTYNNVAMTMEVIFFMHLLSIMLELFGIYFRKHPFREKTGYVEYGPGYIAYHPQQPMQGQPMIAQPKEAITCEQTATIEPPRYQRKKQQPGRKRTNSQYARDWYAWENNGFTDETCPWEHPSEYRNRPPRRTLV